MAGEQIVLIDNVNARLKGAGLAAALTTDRWTDRIIGTAQRPVRKALTRALHYSCDALDRVGGVEETKQRAD